MRVTVHAPGLLLKCAVLGIVGGCFGGFLGNLMASYAFCHWGWGR